MCWSVAGAIDSWLGDPLKAAQPLTLPTRSRHAGAAIGLRGAFCWLLVAWLVLLPDAGSAASPQMRSVLVLYSNSRLLPANVEIDRGLHDVFSAHPEARVDLSTEFLDAQRFSGDAYSRTIATFLRDKYATRMPEVVVVSGAAALAFILQYRQQTFPGVPVIHLAVDAERLKALTTLPSDVIGVGLGMDFLGSVELALRWHPSARRLVLVTGVSERDRIWEGRLRKEAAAFAGRVTVEFLAGLSIEDLKKRLAKLDRDSVVFTPGFFRDGSGRTCVPAEAARLVAGATEAPVYGPYPTFIGTGIVGGSMPSYVTTGRVAADATLSLLAGTAPAAVSVALPKTMPNQVHVDWRQARRFGIPAEAVPGDAIVDFKELSFWEAYGYFVVVGVAVLLIQSALIGALLIERRRRRRTASALAQSEQRMSLAAQAARLSMWSWNFGHMPKPLRTPSRRSTDQLPEPLDDFEKALADVHPMDRPAVEQAVERALTKGGEMDVEYRVAMPDGQTRWMAARGRAAQGDGRQLLGVALDITPRKLAEAQADQDRAALRHMTRVSLLGQLSASIAHQLNQPLASILSNAEAAQAMLRREPVDLAELGEICRDIVAEDHRAAEVIRRLGALFKRGEPTLVPLDVNELVRDTLDLTRTNLLTRHVALTVELAPALPPVDGDRVQLQQLLLNLIVNAADAMDAMPQAERRMMVSTALSDSHVDVCVADRGPGIAEADLPSIFDPFWSAKDAGMGMGLAICRSIAETHRGCLNSRNAPEGGAVFCLQLPIRPAP